MSRDASPCCPHTTMYTSRADSRAGAVPALSIPDADVQPCGMAPDLLLSSASHCRCEGQAARLPSSTSLCLRMLETCECKCVLGRPWKGC